MVHEVHSDEPIMILVSKMLAYVNVRKTTFCSEVHESGKMLSVSVPLSLGCNNNVNSEGVTLECTIFEDLTHCIELVDEQKVIIELVLPMLFEIPFEQVMTCIVGELQKYKQNNTIIGNDEDAEVIVHFADVTNEGEWDEHFGFKSAEIVDFWNEAHRLTWDARDYPFIESDLCDSMKNASKWMEI